MNKNIRFFLLAIPFSIALISGNTNAMNADGEQPPLSQEEIIRQVQELDKPQHQVIMADFPEQEPYNEEQQERIRQLQEDPEEQERVLGALARRQQQMQEAPDNALRHAQEDRQAIMRDVEENQRFPQQERLREELLEIRRRFQEEHQEGMRRMQEIEQQEQQEQQEEQERANLVAELERVRGRFREEQQNHAELTQQGIMELVEALERPEELERIIDLRVPQEERIVEHLNEIRQQERRIVRRLNEIVQQEQQEALQNNDGGRGGGRSRRPQTLKHYLNKSFFLKAGAICLIPLAAVWLYNWMFEETNPHINNALIGKEAEVTTTIKPGQEGEIILDGKKIAARTQQAQEIYAGIMVKIIKACGDHVIVQEAAKAA